MKTKYKIVSSEFDPETGISCVRIQTKNGEFTGYAKCAESDLDIQSSFFGCQIAETKAYIKSLKIDAKKAEAAADAFSIFHREMVTNKDYDSGSFETKRIRKEIKKLRAKEMEIRETIFNIQRTIEASYHGRRDGVERIQERQNKKNNNE